MEKEMKKTINNQENKIQSTPLAVIGMSSIFPQAQNLQEYWDNILQKVDCIVDIPESRWKIDEYYDPDPSAQDKVYCKRGGFIPDTIFDPAEFGLPPNILEATDVTQLLSLVVARECLEDAGYGDGKEFARENVGVILGFVGIGSKLVIPLMARLQYPIWEKVLRSHGISDEDIRKIIGKIKLAYPNWEENSFPGSIGNVVSGRIANRFDLGGTNCVVDAACASSLAAIHMAASELIEGRAEMMITGGVDLDNSIGAYMCFSKTPAFSKSQYPSPFDMDSDGMMVGEGIGMVMLKRLADAERDKDRIYAVIKGIGTSSDGRFKSIYAPRPAGQSLAIQRAYSEAGYSPATSGLIEAHGTGTMAGDPAEFQGMKDVFSEDNPKKQYIALGSVKSQIGHTKAAAGVASLIKVSLALYHKVLPATIHVNTPNPKLEIENSPFYLNTEIRPWIKPANHSRRAGVSSFGFGGTNFHIALEENNDEHTGPYRLGSSNKIILITGSTPEELPNICQEWSEKLQGTQAEQEFINLASGWTSRKIPSSESRLGFVAASVSEAINQLAEAMALLKSRINQESAENNTGVFFRRSGLNPEGKLVALFPGQGSQYLDMGRELAVNFPPMRQAFSDMDALFDTDGLPSLSSVVFPIPVFDQTGRDAQSNSLTRTEHAQPAIGALCAGMYKILQEAGFKADFIAGHSFGELTALWAAGVYEDDDYYMLAKARGKAMAPPPDPEFDAGTMLAVKGDISALQDELKAHPEITLANWNSNNQVVLAGTRPAVATVQKILVEKGYSVVALPVSAAFHTALVNHAQKPFAEFIKGVKFNKPSVPVYSNTSGQVYPNEPENIQQTLAGHILNPVRFRDEIEAIYTAGGRIFVEIGPKNVLTNLVKNILEGKPHTSVAVNPNSKKDSDRQFREAVTQLCVLGLDLRKYDNYAMVQDHLKESKKSAISVMLNGGLYLTGKTRSAFENALLQKDAPVMENSIREPKIIVQETGIPPVPRAQRVEQGVSEAEPNHDGYHVQKLQEETTTSHLKFLSNDAEYTRLFGQITKQELDLLSSNSSQQTLDQINTALKTLDHSMAQFHQNQAETVHVHERFLQNQADLINAFLQLGNVTGVQSTVLPTSNPETLRSFTRTITEPVDDDLGAATHPPVDSTPGTNLKIPAVTTKGPDLENLTHSLLEIVSEKTGYPTEMLELGMDMEADLGIDSIKRVEILGAMQERHPELPKVDATVLSEMRTLGQIVEKMLASAAPTEITTPVADLAEKPSFEEKEINPVSSGIEIKIVKQALLEIVSEKTGYPTEMLDPGMDMEADLGIDSIKRVEILGALQAQFPELPNADPATLAGLRTLDQICEYLTSETIKKEQSTLEDSIQYAKLDEEIPLQHPVVPVHSLPRGVAALQYLPNPDHLDLDFPDNHICILMDDGTDLTPAMSKALSGRGISVVVLAMDKTIIGDHKPLPKNIKRVLLQDLSESGIENTLASLQDEYGPACMFIHLDPPGKLGEVFSDREETIVRTAFLMAKFLKNNLNNSAIHKYAAFVAVTHLDGGFGLNSSREFEPVSGSLFGLVKTLSLEWEKVFCRAIDLSPEISIPASVEHIMAELYDPNRLIREVGYTKTGRYTLVINQTESER